MDNEIEVSVARGIKIRQTILAMFVALVAWAVASVLIGFIIAIAHKINIRSDLGPEIISFMQAIGAGIGGVYAASVACDSFFEHHSRRSIFVMFSLISFAMIMFMLLFVPLHWSNIYTYSQAVVVLISSYKIFWVRS